MMQIFFGTTVNAARSGSTIALIAATALVPRHGAAAEATLGSEYRPSSGAFATNNAGRVQASQSDTARKAKREAKAPHDTTIKRPSRPIVEWPVKGPEPLPGSILPAQRIIAYYGNPLSKRMGILGELPPDKMLARLDKEVAAWNKADSTTPAIPALHLIVTVAQASAGRDGKWRARMPDTLISRVQEWAARRNALLFLDIQVGKSTIRDELPHLATWLAKPNVHLGVDPEFMMKGAHAPGKRIGSIDARDINWVTEFLARIVTEHKIPPKVFVIHRFTRPMVTNYRKIELDPRVQVVMHMDGWGPPHLKKGTYDAYVYAEPVQFTGFKLFYKNDTKKGHPLMKPADLLALTPRPLYIQYQ